MHIPDGFLDPKISTGLLGAAVAVFSLSLAKVRETATALAPVKALAAAGMGSMTDGVKRVLTGEGERLIQRMGMVGALVFAAQMFDFQVLNGGTGHLLGSFFAAAILGPFAGTLVMSAVLALQALFFADGGMIALGANIITMAVVGSFGGYYIYVQVRRLLPDWLALGATAWLSVVMMAAGYALLAGLFGPDQLSIVFPAMVGTHAIIGLAEALITPILVMVFRGFSR